jgi:hypothetical protein
MKTTLKPVAFLFLVLFLFWPGAAAATQAGAALNGYIVTDEGMVSIGPEDVADVYLKYTPEGVFAVFIELNESGKPKANKLFAAVGKKLLLTAGGYVVMNPVPIAGGREPNSAFLRVHVEDERAALQVLKSLTQK